jgi:L-alanine-DL-glutamate epimerase-like enolase superfamily enzyme
MMQITALQTFRGNARAKSALDIAWWNLAAQEQKKPLFEVLDAIASKTPDTDNQLMATSRRM